MAKETTPFIGHAPLIGRVTIAWNQAHYFIFQVFLALHPRPEPEFAETIFFALKSDRAQRDLTLAAARTMIKHPPLLKETTAAIDRFTGLAGRRNAVTHAMWAFQPRPDSGELLWKPHPTFSKKDIKAELNALITDILGATLSVAELPERLTKHIGNRRLLAEALLAPAPPDKE